MAATASAASTPLTQRIDMKVLVITQTTTEPGYGDWVAELNREGMPFDTLVTGTTTALPTLQDTLSDGTPEAKYMGVVVATGGTEGLTTAEWTALQTYEQEFNVRQITDNVIPAPGYGLSSTLLFSGAEDGLTGTLTADGKTAFPYLNGTVGFDTGTFGDEAVPAPQAGDTFDSLVTGPHGGSVIGVLHHADGRQEMVQTYAENQYQLQSELLRHGELNWLTRGTFFGDQRNYIETHVDDNFLSDDTWAVAANATTEAHNTDYNPADALREVPADVTTAAAWSKANNFRIDMLFNGGGSVEWADGGSLVAAGDGGGGAGSTGSGDGSATGTDPLLAAFQTTDPATGKSYANDFGWISHTWDHPNIDVGCANATYIDSELNQNTTWGTKAAGSTLGNPTTGGLGLTSSTVETDALGNDNPSVIITGEHSGLANLIPGNPGVVDPPDQDAPTLAASTTKAVPAGTYDYGVTATTTPVAAGTTGETTASIVGAQVVPGGDGVTLNWAAVCHSSGYKIYRRTSATSTVAAGPWYLIGTRASAASDFGNTGATELTFADPGTDATALATDPPETNGAVESAYEQNPVLDAAFEGSLDGGIKYFGADASKPYPSPADGAFTTGAPPATQYAAGATFSDAGATAIPRYPTNIYYNVSSNAQEIDEYETLYDAPGGTTGGRCVNSATTTCDAAGTTFTIAQIVASIDQGMFQHLMGNDPRPSYFHQTNLMDQTGAANASGSGLFYETLNPLLAQYNAYFASNSPIVQLTMPQIGDLLAQQAAWATESTGQVTGYIQDTIPTTAVPTVTGVVTINNSGASATIPLTGTEVGSSYGGTVSGWTTAPTGASTHTALVAWPPLPTVPAAPSAPLPQAPFGATPAAVPTPTVGNTAETATSAPTVAVEATSTVLSRVHVVEAAPKTVVAKKGRAVLSLKCEALENQLCSGSVKVLVSGKTIKLSYRIKAGKIDRISVKLPHKAIVAIAASTKHHPAVLHARLSWTTQEPSGSAQTIHGKLTIKS